MGQKEGPDLPLHSNLLTLMTVPLVLYREVPNLRL